MKTKKISAELIIFTVLLAGLPALAVMGRDMPNDAADVRQTEPARESTEQASEPIADKDFFSTLTPYRYSRDSEVGNADIGTATEKIRADETVLLFHSVSGEVEELSMEEYVTGAVLAEMPASFHEEALKAQAVACRTYAARQKLRETLSPTDELCGAHLSDDSSKHQAYFSEKQARAFYGDSYEEYYGKVSGAVKEVSGEVLVYEGEPIIAAFHSMSGGRTENSAAVWGGQLDYLVAVDSTSDMKCTDFRSEKTYTAKELSARITSRYPEAELKGDKSGWVTVIDRTASGTVTSVIVGNKAMSGTELREILNLRSACFDVSYNEENGFVFVTRGYGHGVGMSQYGANAMAENGSSYAEILGHYYRGTELIRVGE